MLKKISIRKLIISFSALFTLFLIYLIPNNENDKNKLEDIPQELEYVNNDLVTSSVFLLDSYNMLGKTEVPVSSKDIESLAKELLEVLINGGANEDRIPNGFKSILPSDTKILSLKYDKDLIKVDFSKELLNTSKEMEEKVVEAIIYTLTSINGVNKVIIYVDGNILTKLPQTKINLPSTLDRSFGINKEYDINSIKDINQVTIYYVNKNNDNYYYVPVTKYLNDDRDKIKIVIDELSGNSIYNTNLMSFLNSNAELISSEKKDDLMHLNFNEYIFSDIEEKNILEEVIYTISLSVCDNYEVKGVVFNVENEEIYKTVLKTIE
jgi:germination protein M